MGDDTGDGPGDRMEGRLLSYAELGQLRGISAASAKRLAIRRKWHRVTSNDGLARVRVPDDVTGDASIPQKPQDQAVAASHERLQRLEAELSEARQQIARAEGELAGLRTAMTERGERAEQAEQRERTLIAQLARLEAEQAAFGASLAVTHARAERAEAAEQRERAVIAELTAVRAELTALAARPWWRRLFRPPAP